MSRKIKAMLISIALALTVAVGGIVTAVSLTGNNKKLGGSTASAVAFGTSTTKTAPGRIATQNASYKYTPATGETLGTFTTIPTANLKAKDATNGAYLIDTPGKWLYVIDQMNAGTAAYLSGVYVFAGGTMDFGGMTVTPAASKSASKFTGVIYGNKTTVQNVTFSSVKEDGTAGNSTNSSYNYCGMFGFTNGAKFYDLAMNSTCHYSIPKNVYSVTGGVVAHATDGYFVNVASFISSNITNDNALPEIGAYWGGIVGCNAGSTLYFNGCAFCGRIDRVGVASGNTDNVFKFGGFFGGFLVSNTTCEVYNSASDIKGSFKNTGPCGGAIGTQHSCSNLTIKAKNIVTRIDITSLGSVNSPDYGAFITTYNSAFSTNCVLENIYMYGTMAPAESSVAQEAWLLAKNSSGQLVAKNIVTNMTLYTKGDTSYTSTSGFAKKTTEADVITAAQNNTAISGSGIIINTDGTVGSTNLPAADFNIIYVDQLNPTGLVNGTYNSATGATFANRTTNGATFNGWSVGSWTSTPTTSFTGGGRIGDLNVYARYTMDDTKTTKSATKSVNAGTAASGASASVTYGDNVSFTISLTHPLVTTTGSKAEFTVDGWYVGSGYTTKLVGGTGTGTGTNTNIAATKSGNAYTITFTKPTVAQSMTYRLKYTLKAVSGVNGVTSTTGYSDVTLTVGKATVTNPTFTQEFTYDGAAHSVIATAGSSSLYTYTAADATKTNASDSYSTAFTLNDSANYKWATTTGLPTGVTLPSESGTLTVAWKIKKATLTADQVNFAGGEGGIVGYALNNTNNANGAVSITATKHVFTYAGQAEADLPGTTAWATPTEVISYEYFDFTAAEANDNKSIYKTTAVFTPTDTSIEAFEAEVTINVTGNAISLLDVPVNETTGVDLTPGTASKLWIDRSSTVTIAPQFDGTHKANLTYYWGGVQKTSSIDALAPMGFNAKVYFMNGGATSDITGVNNVFTLDFTTTAGSEYYGKTFYIGYTPATVSFNVYYVLEKTETENFNAGDYVTADGLHYPFGPTATAGSLDSAAGSSSPVVYKASDAKGTTTSFVHYTESGNLLSTTKDMATVITHYDLDTTSNLYLNDLRIKGNGSTVAVVFLKAKYHTVTFLAIGASTDSMQTEQVKYKGKVDSSQINQPTKTGATFNGWFESQTGGNAVNFNNIPIVADTTFYAQFTSSDYYIVFDMNGFTGNAATTAPNQYAINLSAIPSENAASATVANRITWNYNTFFESFDSEDFFYAAAANGTKWKAGDYVFHYTVDSLKSNISLNVNAGKPSAISYTFSDWYNGNTRTRSITAPANYTSGTPDEVITLTARWTKQNYTLVFDKQDGSRTTQVSGVANLSTWDAIFAKNATSQALKAPTRNGYTFEGWYATADCEGNEVTSELGAGGVFSVADYKDLYKTTTSGTTTYNFSNIRLYAYWESVKIELNIDQDIVGGQVLGIDVTDEYLELNPDSNGEPVIDVEVEATIEADAGYQFSYLIVGARRRPIYKSADGKIKFTIANTDVVFVSAEDDDNDYGYAYNKLDITAVFTEISYTISYNTDGGTSSDDNSNIARTYVKTQLDAGNVKLPSKLTKLGYDFGGWVFENAVADGAPIVADGNITINGQYAFVTDGMTGLGEISLYGETLTLKTFTIDDVDWYANFSLKAVWIKQAAELRLYGVNYGNDINYGNADATEKCYILNSIGTQKLYTDDIVTIKSPVSYSFYFVGWATRPGGEVVYAAELKQVGKDTSVIPNKILYEAQDVEYKIKASKNLNNADTKANYLYAVWQVKDISYVNVSAANNNSVYNGTGIKLTAKTAENYEDDESAGSITLVYNWYRVKDNQTNDEGETVVDYYKNVFTVTKRIYLNEFGEEIGSITYDLSGNVASTVGDVTGTNFIEEKSVNMDALEDSCDSKGEPATKSGSTLGDSVEYTVPSVAQAGRYICVAQVVGSSRVAFGEITVTMQKAQFSNVVFQSAIEAYNGENKSIAVKLSTTTTGATMSGNVITLPDGTKVTVTYGYKLAGNASLSFNDGVFTDVNGNVTDENGYLIGEDGKWLQKVKNAGKYNVTARFAITEDKGNYTVISSLSADLEITQRTLTNISFAVTHNEQVVTNSTFSYTYDGDVYVVSANINDKTTEGLTLPDVVSGSVKAVVKIYTADASGNKQTLVTDNDGNALNAGKYVAEITGLEGSNSKSYKLGTITKTQVFEIAKAKRDYGISFEDAEVTFDNKVHTISITSNTELPSTLTVEYEVKATLDEETLKTYSDGKVLSNSVYLTTDVDGQNVTSEMAGEAITNGGRHAGTYEVSVKFTDSESANYEPIEVEPATLTIKKANLFKFYATDDDKTEESGIENLLTNHGFASATYAFNANENRKTFINGGLLLENDSANDDYFTIKYNVYRKVDGEYQGMASGTEAQLSSLVIRTAGTYKIEADISYASPLYKNNFEEISDAPYIEIEIMEGVISSISVNYKANRTQVQYIGETLSIADNIDNIVVHYTGSDMTLSGDDLAIVKVVYGEDHESFWKVGTAVDLVFDVYGVITTPTANDKIKIMQKITEGADLRYSVDGGDYNSVPENGLDIAELTAEGVNYAYRLYFDGIDGNGEEAKGLYVEVTVNASTLKRGSNVITVSNADLYDLSGLTVTLDAYKTVKGEITWKYSLNGTTWTVIDMDAMSLPYAGSEYYIGAFFTGDNGNEAFAYASANSGAVLNAGGYDLTADEYTDGDEYAENNKHYRLDGVMLTGLTVAQHELSFTWENVTLKYTGEAQKVNLATTGVLEQDTEDIGFEYSYYKLTKNGDGEVTGAMPITDNVIVNAGDYRVTVSGIIVNDGGDGSKLGNYVLPEQCSHDFTIGKADVKFAEVYYEESNYGKNQTYQNNPQGLRRDKLVGAFGDNIAIEGEFYFVVFDTEINDYKIYENDKDIAGRLTTAGTIQIQYMYAPLDIDNYNVLIKPLSIRVLSQVATNSLRVVRKAGAVDFYIVESMVGSDRIDVYRQYTSFYVEDGEEYGKLELLSSGYNIQANGTAITGTNKYKVKDTDEKVTITVTLTTNTNIKGSLDFKVYSSQPTSITISQNEKDKIKADWYVGEKFELPSTGSDAVKFSLNFDGEDSAPLTFADMTYAVSGVGFNGRNETFTEAGTATITFAYAGLTVSIDIEVKAKENLVIATPNTKTLLYDGTAKAVPEIEFTAGEVAGVKYTYTIEKRGTSASGQYVYTPVASMVEEGTYRVIYTFEVTNPRYNKPEEFRMTIDVKKVAYQAEWSEFTEAQLTSVYSGSKVTPPVARVSNVRDIVNNRDLGAVATVRVTSVNGETDSTKWNINGYGTYTIVATATYNGAEIGTKTYTYTVTKAENSANLEVKNILVGEQVSYEVTDLHFGEFNAETMITFSSNPDSGFTSTVPTRVGRWYIKLEVEGTNDYADLVIVKSFTISNKNLSSGNKDNDGNVWVDVDGGDDGIAPGTVLGVTKVDEDVLSGLKLKNQNVHDGYDVTLKDAAGNDVELEDKVTIKLLITEDLRESKNKLGVYVVTVDANGKTKTEEVKNVKKSEDGKYLVFSASSVGRFVITEKLPTAPGGLIAGVSVGAVVAAGLIVACVLVFLKKRK